jgi:hypothetical protein
VALHDREDLQRRFKWTGDIVKNRWSSTFSLALLIAGGLALVSPSLAGQTTKFQPPANVPGAGAVKSFLASRMAKGFTPTKTSWGDPDISGVFTTKDEANTPFERPAAWAGRRMEDITPKEFAEAIVERQQQALERAPFAGGGDDLVEQGVAIAVPIHWFDNLASQNSRPWFVIDPVEGKVPAPLPTAAAFKSNGPNFLSPERDSYTDRSLTDRCITGTIWKTPNLYGNSHDIVQTPNHVMFRYEAQRTARVIRLNQPHLSPSIRPLNGDSIGWWDGNTLVVETTNFPAVVEYRGYSMADLRVIERFTRIGPKTVEWSMTFDNPKIWPTAWTYSYPMTEDLTQPIHEYACHEGNYGLANILSAGRAVEAKGSSGSPAKRQ